MIGTMVRSDNKQPLSPIENKETNLEPDHNQNPEQNDQNPEQNGQNSEQNGQKYDDAHASVTPGAKRTLVYLQRKLQDRAAKGQRRVKVYLLKDDNWLDHGTGFCTGEIDDETHKPFFIVRNELDQEDIILKAFLEGNTQYQRQQETLIVWTDPSGKDIALSFQETEGCADLCDFIIDMQQHDLSPEISLYYVISNNQISDENGTTSDITELVTGPIEYPPIPTLANLEEILETLNQRSTSSYYRSRILKFIVEKEYFMELIRVFNESEQQHNLINLYSLSEIIKTLILYSESAILEDIVTSEEKILGIIGILEYDAEFPNQKSCHRDFLSQKANFKYVINLPVELMKSGLNIFKKDFYLNFLKDVILARFIDDQSFNMINTLIHFNQVEINQFLKDSEHNGNFLEKLFALYKNKSEDLESKRSGVNLLHQYVISSKNLHSFQRTDFYSILIQNGLLDMIKFALNDSDLAIKVLGTELIVSIIEQDVSLVNSVNDGEAIDNSEPPMDYHEPEIDAEYPPDQSKEKEFGLKLSDDMTLMTLLAQLLLTEKNFGLKTQAFDALKSLLDYNIGKMDDENGVFEEFGTRAKSKQNNDISTEDYFKAFYTAVAPILYKSLIRLSDENTEQEVEGIIKHDELLYQKLCELLSFCIVTHDKCLYRPFFLDNHIITGISKLLKLDCKMILKLSAVRCLSNILAINDKLFIKYFLDHHILDTFFEFFQLVSQENNLANSTCLSLLEVLNEVPIGKNKVTFKLLINYISDHYKEFCLNELNYVSTGRDLIKLNDQLDTVKANLTAVNGDINTDGDMFDDNDSDELLELENHSGTSDNHGSNANGPKNLFEEIEKEFETKPKRQRDPDDTETLAKKSSQKHTS